MDKELVELGEQVYNELLKKFSKEEINNAIENNTLEISNVEFSDKQEDGKIILTFEANI